MLSKTHRISLALLACLTALSLSTVATAGQSDDDDEEQTESRKSRKKARKAAADEDDDDASSSEPRKRRSRRSDPDEDDDDDDEEAKPKKPVEAPSYSQRTGFVLQTGLLTQTTAFTTGTVAFQLSSFEGGLTFGYKTGRLMLGLGFDFTNLSQATPEPQTDPDTGEVTFKTVATSTYSFVVYPELQYAFVQSADQRVEMVGNVSLGLGSFGTSRSDVTNAADDITELRVRWRFGPGVRYWIHPQLGVTLATGVTGNHLLIMGPSDAASSSSATASLFTQISLAGVF